MYDTAGLGDGTDLNYALNGPLCGSGVHFPTSGQEVYNGDFRYKCYHECEDFPVEYCPTNFGCALSRVAAPIDVHALPTADAPFAIDIEFRAGATPTTNQLLWGYGEDQDGQPAANRLLLTGTGLRYEWTVGSCALEYSVGATDGLWHHARVSFDGARRSLFYDGVLVHVEDETQASCANAYDGVATTDRQNAHVDATNFALGTADLTLVQAAAPTAVQFEGALRDFKAYDVAHAPLPRPTVFAHRAEEAFGGVTASCDRAQIRVDAAASKLPTGSEPYTVRAEFQCGAYAHDEAVLFSHGAVADNQLLSVSYHASTQTLTHAWGTSAATRQTKQFASSLCDDAWHEVVVSWDGEVKRMHLDGAEVAAEIVSTHTDVTPPADAGGGGDAGAGGCASNAAATCSGAMIDYVIVVYHASNIYGGSDDAARQAVVDAYVDHFEHGDSAAQGGVIAGAQSFARASQFPQTCGDTIKSEYAAYLAANPRRPSASPSTSMTGSRRRSTTSWRTAAPARRRSSCSSGAAGRLRRAP